ncbi:hypothetical protein CMO94_03340 [Candidatus Woesearchaeota archaeon]|jgi:hypothetical protein|nr:hypothetical protein [Candidatus Woesearchaeota archaeon]MDP7244515.1 hypothetical protein [Flavobacteriales bacterium]
MSNLVDILEREGEKYGLSIVDSGVLDIFNQLSGIVEIGIGEERSRLEANHIAVLYFLDGLKNNGTKTPFGFPYIEKGIATKSRVLGLKTRLQFSDNIEGIIGKEKQPKIKVGSYGRFSDDLNRTLVVLDTELGDLESAYQDPLAYLYAKLPKVVSSHKYVSEAMAQILRAYDNLTADLLNEDLEEGFIENFIGKLERKSRKSFDDHMQLGIAYMFKGNMVDAAEHFKDRRRNSNNEYLIDAMRTLADNIHYSNRIFSLVYSKIEFVRNFQLYTQSK